MVVLRYGFRLHKPQRQNGVLGPAIPYHRRATLHAAEPCARDEGADEGAPRANPAGVGNHPAGVANDSRGSACEVLWGALARLTVERAALVLGRRRGLRIGFRLLLLEGAALHDHRVGRVVHFRHRDVVPHDLAVHHDCLFDLQPLFPCRLAHLDGGRLERVTERRVLRDRRALEVLDRGVAPAQQREEVGRFEAPHLHRADREHGAHGKLLVEHLVQAHGRAGREYADHHMVHKVVQHRQLDLAGLDEVELLHHVACLQNVVHRVELARLEPRHDLTEERVVLQPPDALLDAVGDATVHRTRQHHAKP
mmetsp:Transcript_45243/g.124481  ORF Transcript_45243/g.124481 Transcript_45243/m.124481 type:complete len:309 (-) Transcript_45243:2000-2926(-)